MEVADDPGSGLSVSPDVRALASCAAAPGRGPVTADQLWDALSTVSEREWLRLERATRPAVRSPDPGSGEALDGIPLSLSGAAALRLARFLALHYEDDRVEVGHVAVALAGLPDPQRRLTPMQQAADAFFGMQLVHLDRLLPRFRPAPPPPPTAGHRPAGTAGPRRSVWGGWTARRAWKQRFKEAMLTFDRGELADAVDRFRELVREAEEVGPAPMDHVLACEFGASAALYGDADLRTAAGFCERGLAAAPDLDEPLRSILRGRLLQLRASISLNLGQLAVAEADLRDSGALMVAGENHPAARLPIVSGMVRELGTSHRLTAAWLSHTLGRWDDAARLTSAAVAYAESRGARGKALMGTAFLGQLLMEMGDVEQVTGVAARLMDYDLARDLAPLHATMRTGAVALLSEIETWLCLRRGDHAGAVSALTLGLDLIDGAPDWATTVDQQLRLRSRLWGLHLAAGDRAAAAAVEDQLRPAEVVAQLARGDVLAVWLGHLAATGDRERCVTTLRDFDDRHGADALLPQQVLEAVPVVARAALELGEPEWALTYLERVTAAMAVLSGGRLPAGIRAAVLRTRADVRDGALWTATGVAQVFPDRAGRTALQCADTWRESTLAAAVTSDAAPLPATVRDLVQQIEHATVAAEAESRDPTGLPLTAETGRAARRAATVRLAELRGQLAEAIGESLAQFLAPTPRTAPHLPAPTGEALLSVTALGRDGAADPLVLVTSWQLPDGSAGVVRRTVGPAAAALVGQLAAGLAFRSLTELEDWDDAWQAVAGELAAAVLPRPVREWVDRTGRPTVRYAFDGELGNLPLAALPLDGGRRLVDAAAANRVPFLRWVERPASTRSDRPRVLAHQYDTAAATAEREHLEALHDSGRIDLTVAPSLADVVPLLAGREFDALLLSCHGDGRGLDFRFHDGVPGGHSVSAHQLLGVRVPHLVVAASCYSGTDGAVDIAGVLATLLSRGAHSVISGSWELPDADTARLLTSFYELLDAPGTVAERLRAAQLASGLTGREVPSWAGLTCTTL